jgi:hypothetical protein
MRVGCVRVELNEGCPRAKRCYIRAKRGPPFLALARSSQPQPHRRNEVEVSFHSIIGGAKTEWLLLRGPVQPLRQMM